VYQAIIEREEWSTEGIAAKDEQEANALLNELRKWSPR
jgi:hypothetical protein